MTGNNIVISKMENEIRPRNDKNYSAVGYIFGAAFTLLFLYLINRYWTQVPHLTTSFIAVLWILNLSMIYSVIVNILLSIFGGYYFKHLLKLTENLFSMIVILTFYKIFPLDLTGQAREIAIILIILGFIGTFIGLIVEVIKLISKPPK